MSADQAFDNLLGRNAIAIPEAAPGGDSGAAARLAPSRPGDGFADYQPVRAEGSPAAGAVPPNRPTEVDLEPADAGMEDFAALRGWGAEIVGRDAGDEGGPDQAEAADSDLSGARRIKRFSYLPLSGMNEFESGARLLAANLSARLPKRPSLAVTGARRGEGRTELAIRFALALARKVEHRILLADFDAEKPEVALRLGLSAKHFVLADVLRGSCRLGEALTVGEEDNLYVLPSRAPERDGDEIFDSRRVESLFENLHQTFDFVIIDCGPVDRADTAIVARQAGSVVLAGRPGISLIAELRAAAAELPAMGANLAGMILVGA